MKSIIKKAKFQHAVFAICCIFSAVMLIGKYNFLSVIGVVFAMAISLLMLIISVAKKRVNVWLLFSHMVLMISILIFYLIWGADNFIKRLWYNMLWSGIPVLLSIGIYFINKQKEFKLKKIISSLVIFLILTSTSLYFFIMSIRVKPSVFSLQQGHDEYLNSIKNSYTIDDSNPNVLVILMDDMAYSDLSCYSYLGRENATIKTPNIDALADDGIMMDNFYACSPVCSPSRFGMLTGRYSARGYLDNVIFPTALSLQPFGNTRYLNAFQFPNNIDGILGDEITFPEVMQNVGYRTALFGKWNLGDYGEYLPTNQGFDYFYGSYYVNDMTPYNMVRETKGNAEEVYSHNELIDQSETTKILTEEITTYINKSVDNNEKFLAYYATPWPHYPIFSGVKGDATDDNYIDCIEEFDTYLGNIIDLLKEKDIYNDTLIMFTSDNGPGREGVTGALRGRKGTTFDGGQKVPFIATYVNGGIGKSESFVNNNIISENAMNIDVFPTILQYIGVDTLPYDRVIDGKSLYSLLQGTVDSDTSLHEMIFHIHRGKVQGIQMPKIIDGEKFQFKYYQNVWTENAAFFDQFYKNYLFNLTTDPAEGYNISMKHPEIAKEMLGDLQSFKKELKTNRRGVNLEYYK